MPANDSLKCPYNNERSIESIRFSSRDDLRIEDFSECWIATSLVVLLTACTGPRSSHNLSWKLNDDLAIAQSSKTRRTEQNHRDSYQKVGEEHRDDDD